MVSLVCYESCPDGPDRVRPAHAPQLSLQSEEQASASSDDDFTACTPEPLTVVQVRPSTEEDDGWISDCEECAPVTVDDQCEHCVFISTPVQPSACVHVYGSTHSIQPCSQVSGL